MPKPGIRRARTRGRVEELPSGSLRVSVYAGVDPVTRKRKYLREVVPGGPGAAAEAEKAIRRLANQVDERRHPTTSATVSQLLDRHFAVAKLDRTTLATYRGYADKHIRPLIGNVQVGALDADIFDSFYSELQQCRAHCRGARYIEHRTQSEHECDRRCRQHSCAPLGPATVRQIHFILSGALKRAVRWRWIAVNPITQAEPPPAPKPHPRPPNAGDAARILMDAWTDPDWGTLVWLVMVTGIRRGELCGIRWRNLDLVAGVLDLDRSIGQRGSAMWEKDTKTHQHRRIALDVETVEVLLAHRERCGQRAEAVEASIDGEAFVFSLVPDGSRHLQPNSVSQRYAKLVRRLGITTSIHKLRHFSATELISAGVDIRTVAGRLGHSGGGTTTLRTYAAWVSESDQRAAVSLSSRLPALPVSAALPQLDDTRSVPPYQRIAAALRLAIQDGGLPAGLLLPALKVVADEYGVAVATAHRALDLLRKEGLVILEPGRGFRVCGSSAAAVPVDDPVEPTVAEAEAPRGSGMYDVELRRRTQAVSRFRKEVDPTDAEDLLDVLLDAVRRSGGDESSASDYELVVTRPGDSEPTVTYVARRRRSQPPA